MPTDLLFEKRSPMPVSAAELFAWHARPGAFDRLAPPWERVEIVGGSPQIADGSRVELRMAKGPLRLRWLAEHRRVRPGSGFRDVQVRGPFALWQHDHLFEPLPEGGAALLDRIRFRPPAGPLGRLLMERSLRRDLERMFRYRHATTADDLELHARFAGRDRLRVALTGAGGLLGRTLAGLLTTGGHEVVRLTHAAADEDAAPPPGAAARDGRQGAMRPGEIERLDALVHLDGGADAGGTRGLVDSLRRLQDPPRALVCASDVGIYGNLGDAPVDESAGVGNGPSLLRWRHREEDALSARELGLRVALVRLGAVLSPAGGLLARLLRPFRLGLGGRLGDGRQRLSWISVDDAAAAILHVLMTESLDGPVHLAAPEAPSNRQLAAALGGVLGRPAVLALPAAAAPLLYGWPGARRLRTGVWARPSRLAATGFRFRHPLLEPALRHLLGRSG